MELFAQCPSDLRQDSWDSAEGVSTVPSVLSELGSESTAASGSPGAYRETLHHSQLGGYYGSSSRHLGPCVQEKAHLKLAVCEVADTDVDRHRSTQSAWQSARLPNNSSVGCLSSNGSAVELWPARPGLLMMSPAAAAAREVSAGIGWDDACDTASMQDSVAGSAEGTFCKCAEQEDLRCCRIDLFVECMEADLREDFGRWLRPAQLEALVANVKKMKMDLERRRKQRIQRS